MFVGLKKIQFVSDDPRKYNDIMYPVMLEVMLKRQAKFEDTKRITRTRIMKDRQNSDQKKKDNQNTYYEGQTKQ